MRYQVIDHTIYRTGTYNALNEALARFQAIVEAGHKAVILPIVDVEVSK